MPSHRAGPPRRQAPPSWADAVAHYQAGRLAEAEASVCKGLAGAPANPEGLGILGAVLRAAGRPDEALASYDRSLALAPRQAGVWTNRANLLNDLRRFAEAMDSADRALALAPSTAVALNARANACSGLGQLSRALADYDRALNLQADYFQARFNRANALMGLGRFTDALADYRRAAELVPGSAAAWAGCGDALATLSRWPEALAAYDRAWGLDPEQPFLRGHRLHASMKLGRWDDLDARIRDLAAAVDAGKPAALPFPLLAMPLPATPPPAALQRRAAEIYVTRILGPGAPPRPRPALRSGPLRIGYFSADFQAHATAYLIAELIELHDRAAVEVIGLSFGPGGDDPMRQRLRAGFDRFFEVGQLDDAAIADLAQGLDLDIAVDLKGFTTGARPGLFARRLAPVQVSYLGFPATMGAPFIDYLVADPVLIGEDDRHFYSEKIAYLGGCYQPNDRQRPMAAATRRGDHGLPEAGVVLAAFNNGYKITPRVFDIWMRVLASTDDAVLWLFEDNPQATASLRREVQVRGVDPARLVAAPKLPLDRHLERLGQADLFLDTFPYTAHTTGSDALWAGLPLVTLRGDTFAGRVAASLLTAVGMEELIAASVADYEALALALAADPPRLAALRRRLAGTRDSCRLFDTPRYARELEALYLAMHRRAAAGLPPDHILPGAG